MPTKNITIRMDNELKQDFSCFCDEIGMSMGTAFTIFAKAVVREKRIPFELNVSSPNKETIIAMLEAEQISRDSSVKKYNNTEELFRDLDSDEI